MRQANIKRAEEIYRMRLAGSKFHEIGKRFGISTPNARQIYERCKSWETSGRPKWTWGLHRHESLTDAGYSSRDQIAKALLSGKLTADWFVWEWAGLEKPKVDRKVVAKPIHRAIELLQRHGYKVICPE